MKILAAIVLLIIAATLSACGGGGAASDSTPTGRALDFYTIGQSGMSTSPWGDGTASHQPAVAVKFTPASYPTTIRSVTIYAKNNTGGDQLFNLNLCTDLTTASNLFAPLVNQVIPDTGSSYIAKTIDIPDTTIASGSFYVAVEWVTKPLNSLSGANAFFILTDQNPDYLDDNFIRFDSTWRSYASFRNTGGDGDLGIVVNY